MTPQEILESLIDNDIAVDVALKFLYSALMEGSPKDKEVSERFTPSHNQRNHLHNQANQAWRGHIKSKLK